MKRLLVAVGVFVLCIGLLAVMSLVRQGNDRRALAAYKAQLRAQGEWLTIEDAGYPFTLETNADLRTFTTLAGQLAPSATIFARLDFMPFAGPGLMIETWKEKLPPIIPGSRPNPAVPPQWEQLSSACDGVTPALAALRADLEHPPRRFAGSNTNLSAWSVPMVPFVQMRQTAQAFAADTLVALRADDLDRAGSDLRALTQMTHLLGDDLRLVSAMMRVAMAGLGLGMTAEALQHEDWDEPGLAALQRDWEAVDLAHAVEQGVAGEQIYGLQVFTQCREPDPRNTQGPSATGARAGLRDQLQERLATLYWRAYMDRDELFYVQHHQKVLDILRSLDAQQNWASLEHEFKAQQESFDRVIMSPLGRYQYRYSAIGIASVSRAAQTTVRRETQRRMTVTAIALKRFHLREGHHPGELGALVPAFLDPVPIDPWSGTPLHYRLNPDGSYLLYSVGEDGIDDGGDCTPASAPKQIDFWTGKDVVWPRVFPVTRASPE